MWLGILSSFLFSIHQNKMNIFVIVINCILITTIYANSTLTTDQITSGTTSINTSSTTATMVSSTTTTTISNSSNDTISSTTFSTLSPGKFLFQLKKKN